MTNPKAPTKTAPAKAAPVKAAPAPAPAFSLDSLGDAVAATAPRRNDDNNHAVSPKVLAGLQDSWANRSELTKARDAVPAKDGKPAKPAVKATELGDGRAFSGLPEAAVKVVEAQLRKGAAALKLGVSIRTSKEENGTYTVRFAAKTLKSTEAKNA